MTALTYDGATPTVGADADVWGTELNDALGEIYTDLQMLNTTPTGTVLCRTASGTGEVERKTLVQVAVALPSFTGDSGSGGVKGVVPAPGTGDGAAGWYLKANGTWGSDFPAWGAFAGSTGAEVGGRGYSITRNSAGNYDVAFDTALSSTAYAVLVSYQSTTLLLVRVETGTKTVNGFTILSDTPAANPFDPDQVYFQVILG